MIILTVQLDDLRTFLTVAAERSFSAAAKKLHRTQPAISQAVRRLEDALGDRLFDRSSRNGTLTEAGRLLQDYAGTPAATGRRGRDRRPGAAAGASRPRRHWRQRGGGPHPAALPAAVRSRSIRRSLVEVRRVPSRQIAGEIARTVRSTCGVLTFQPLEKGLQSLPLGERRTRDADAPEASARESQNACRSRRSGDRW